MLVNKEKIAMLQLLHYILMHFQWPKVKKEVSVLFPKTIALAERMEYDLMTAVNQIGNQAVGVDILYIDPKNGKVEASLSELKMLMEQCARMSLGLICSKDFRKNFDNFPGFQLKDWVAKLETLCEDIMSKRQADACIPYPLITRSPSFFITGNTMTDPWFLWVPGRKIPKMIGA